MEKIDERWAETRQFKTSIRNSKVDSTYVYNLESFKNVEGYAIPYACACVSASKLKQSLKNYINDVPHVPQELEEFVIMLTFSQVEIVLNKCFNF